MVQASGQASEIRVTRFASVQVMRAVAAMAVLFFHQSLLPIGYAGVDIFFVISGFIMGTIGMQERPGDFLGKRLIRIVPLYWAVTIAMCLASLHPGLFATFDFTSSELIKSLLFIPYARPTGEIWPLVVPGWTLNYEMLFYAVFWLGLVLERPLLTCGLVILGLALSAVFVVPSDPVWRSWSDPLMLEFVAGLVLSRMTWLRGGWIGAVLMLLATVGYSIVIGLLADFGHWRVLALGLPALLLVSGAVALDRAGCWPSIRPLELIGDCSYSLYLLHGIAIKLVEKFVRPDSVTAVLLGLIASLLAAYLSYRYFELPVAHALRRLLPARRRRAAG